MVTPCGMMTSSVLYMKLDYEIPDRTVDNPFGGISFNSMETKDATGMTEILRNIEHAKTDPNIKGIYMELSSIPTSTAMVTWPTTRVVFGTISSISGTMVKPSRTGMPILALVTNLVKSSA